MMACFEDIVYQESLQTRSILHNGPSIKYVQKIFPEN